MSKTRVLKEKCKTCIFRPGNKMHLRPGAVDSMVKDALAGGGTITCHSTLDYCEPQPAGEAVCRGFYDVHGYRSNLIRIMERLDGIEFVDVPTSLMDRKDDHD